jgi:Response regulators consisting of a CheY-like receiver domain and a winged-helix DNA-binding domain
MDTDQQPVSLEERKAECKPLVLVVDDNPQYAKIFELLSDSLGIQFHIVNSCGEAVKALEMFSFDVVLMDWMMPEVDGPMCARKIRSLQEQSGQKFAIVAVSGYMSLSKERCLQAGMDDFLQVPFTLEELNAKLCEWLQKKEEHKNKEQKKEGDKKEDQNA